MNIDPHCPLVMEVPRSNSLPQEIVTANQSSGFIYYDLPYIRQASGVGHIHVLAVGIPMIL